MGNWDDPNRCRASAQAQRERPVLRLEIGAESGSVEAMENYKLVLPANLNHYGYLFGGDLLKWVDEYAWVAATLDYPGCRLVTVGMDRVEFKRSVRKVTILLFQVERTRQGLTSAQYRVTVFDQEARDGTDPMFATGVTLVRVDSRGRKQRLPGRK